MNEKYLWEEKKKKAERNIGNIVETELYATWKR